MAKEILIANSDKSDQEEFQKIFKTTDYHLVFSGSGEDVLLRAKLFKPDLIILGMSFGEKDNLEVCKAIKTDPEFKHIPVILLSNIFEEISEKDCHRVHADGVISRPLFEDEILNLVDHLMGEGAVMAEKEGIFGKEEEWRPFPEIEKTTHEKKEELFLDEFGGTEEEEIIELLDVIEEPEEKLSIDDFVVQEKEEIPGEITPLESWEKIEEEKPPEKVSRLFFEEKEKETEKIPLKLEKEEKPKKITLEEELFEKIDLEELIGKIEQLEPSLEKEWPARKEVKALEESLTMREEPVEKSFDLEEFETALKKEMTAEPLEEKIQPSFIEELKAEIPSGVTPLEIPIEEEELKELPEEEFTEELMEELGEKEMGAIEEPKEIKIEKSEELKAPRFTEVEARPLVSRVDRQMGEFSPLVKAGDKHLEEVIAKGIQDMLGDFITKILPEMTQNIIGLTAERIEKMVKEIVPDLAEKAIQEEIKRLQKGKKD